MFLLKELDFTLGPKGEEALKEKKTPTKTKITTKKPPQNPHRNKKHNKTNFQQIPKQLAPKAWYSCDELHSSIISGVWLWPFLNYCNQKSKYK